MGSMTRRLRIVSLGLGLLAIISALAILRPLEEGLNPVLSSSGHDASASRSIEEGSTAGDETSSSRTPSRGAKEIEVRLFEPPVISQEPGGPVRVSSDGYEQTFSAESANFSFGDRSLSLRLKDLRIGGSTLVASDSPVAPRLEKGTQNEVVYQRGEVTEKYLLKGGAVEQIFVLSKSLASLRAGGPLSVVVALDSALRPIRRAGTKAAPGDTIEFRDGSGASLLTYGSATAIDASGRTQPLAYALRGSDLEMTLDGAFLASASFPLTIDPTISVTPSSLTFNAPLGGPYPAPQTVKMRNTSATTSLRWRTTITTTSGGAWLTCSPQRGKRKPGQSKSVTVQVAMTTLAAGTYTGNIHFFDQTDATNFFDLPVTLNVRGLPFIDVQPSAGLVFNAPTGSGVQPTQDFTLTNQGGQTLN